MDDGSAESSLGLSGSQVIWLNVFQASEDITVDTVSIAFGWPGSIDLPGNGGPVSVYLWSDPNNDGIPFDAVLERSNIGVTSDFGTDTFVDFSVAPFDVTSGGFFFVGFQSTDFAVGRDTDSSAGQSYIFSNGTPAFLDPNALGAIATSGRFDDFSFPGNALIRASGVVVPEPSSFFLSISALIISLSVLRRKRRRS